MTAPVKLSGALPDDRLNGLFAPDKVTDFLAQPASAVYVICVVTNAKTETNNETGAVVPVLKIRHVEVVDNHSAGKVAEILQHAHEGRTGEMMLPFERGEDIPAPGQAPPEEGTS